MTRDVVGVSYAAEMPLVMSATSGMSSFPTPPSSRGVFVQARCTNLESIETPTTSVLICLSSLANASEYDRISVGQTNV